MHRIAAAANLALHPLANADVMALSLADPLLRWVRDHMVAGVSSTLFFPLPTQPYSRSAVSG